MTADRSGSASLNQAPSVDAAPQDQPSKPLTRLAEAITRFGLPAFILCLPLEFTSELFRLQLARIVLLIVGIAFAYLVVTRRRTIDLPLSPSSVFIAFYAAASVISWLLTRAPGSTNALGDVVVYPVMAVLVVNLTRTERAHRDAWMAFLVSGLLIALLVGVLYFSHVSIWRPDPDARVNATFGDPNIAARFLTLGVCAAIVLFAARRVPGWLAVSVASLPGIALVFTLSRSAAVAFPVAVVISAAVATNRRRAAAIAAVSLLALTSALVLTHGAVSRLVPFVQSVPLGAANVASQATSATPAAGQAVGTAPAAGQATGSALDPVRNDLINAGLQMFKDHPIAGVGFGGFQHAILTTYRSYIQTNPPISLSHTAAVTILAEQGLVGALVFGMFLVLLLKEVIASLRRRTEWKDWIVAPAVVLVPILALSQAEGRLIEEPYFWLALGLLYSAKSLERSIRTFPLGL